MLIYSTGVQPPRTAEDFEDMCHIVYSEVFDDLTATKNGRSGQSQSGVDIFAIRRGHRVGVQCKRKTFGKLTRKIIDDEVALADGGPVKIDELIVATTGPNDVAMVAYAAQLSDSRQAAGKFRVSVAFWDTLETYIRRFPRLQTILAPAMPGGAYWDQKQTLSAHTVMLERIEAALSITTPSPESIERGIPEARADSLNKLIDAQLDRIKDQLVAGRVDDALTALAVLGENLDALDVHQRARWHTQHAHCYWQKDEFEHAAREFAHAYELTPNDEKVAGNAVRGLMLAEDYGAALTLAVSLRQRFPVSTGVFAAWIQASERNGRKPEWKDVPPELRSAPEVLHVFAWIELLAGQHAKAAHFAAEAETNGEQTFDTAALRLLALVNQATLDGVLASNGIVAPDLKASLMEIAEFFEPIDEKLWTRQGESSVSQVAACLGYAYMLTDNAPMALSVVLEAAKRFPKNGQLARICLECYMRVGREDEAYEFGKGHLASIEDESKVMLAEMAARRADDATFEEIRVKLTGNGETQAHADELQAFEWLRLARHGRTVELAEVLTDTSIVPLKSVRARIVALSIAKREGMSWADKAIQQLSQQITSSTHTGEAAMAAQLCMLAHCYGDVIRILEPRLPKGYASELHSMLFSALVRSGSRRKALQMLRSFPEAALEDEAVRVEAIELAREASDWDELSRFSEIQLAAHPNRADAWGFRVTILLGQRRVPDVRELLSRDIPLSLDGAIRYQAQLARLEVDFGQENRGLKRLYCMYRGALNNEEAASAYLGHILMMPAERLPKDPTAIAAGCVATISTPEGSERVVVVDPDKIAGLPDAAQFITTASSLFNDIKNKSVGDTVRITDGLGIEREYAVTNVQSAYRYLGQLAQELIIRSVPNKGPLTSVEMTKGPDGQFDLSNILAVLKRQGDRSREIFAAYGQGAITIGIVGKLLGASAAVVAGDWPQNIEPRLYVCDGTPIGRSSAEQLLLTWSKPVVIDLATINELVATDTEVALALRQPLYISSSAVATLDILIANEQSDNSTANMREQNGRIVLTEYDENFHKHRLTYLERLRRCIEQYCQVVPVYGVDEPPEALLQLRAILDDESFDALLLTLEKDALLLTLDGRLRELGAALAGIRGIWPQVYVQIATRSGLCNPDEYSEFVMTSLIKRRGHVSVSALDFMYVLRQSVQFQTFALPALSTYLADSTVDVRSAAAFASEVLRLAVLAGATLGAASRILELLLAPIFTRDDIDPDGFQSLFSYTIAKAVDALIVPSAEHPMEAANAAARQEAWFHVLSNAITKARKVSVTSTLQELVSRPLSVAPLYGSSRPTFVVTRR